ncbi:hypothetical protein CsSME_00003077 [Camellia sinensis var. sinensis]
MSKNKRSRISDYLDRKRLEKSSLIKEVTRHCLPDLSDMSSLSDLLLQLSVSNNLHHVISVGCYPVSEVPSWNLICLHSVSRTGGPVMGAQHVYSLLPGSGGSFMELVIRNVTRLRGICLESVFASQPMCLPWRFRISGYDAKPIGAGLGRDMGI